MLKAFTFVWVFPLFFIACHHPKVETTTPFADAERFTVQGERPLPERWWIAFEDTQLNQQIETALAGNFTLKGAWQRLLAADSLLSREAALLFPEFSGGVEIGSGEDSDGNGETSFGLSLDAGYEVDLWGRIDAEVEVEKWQKLATFENYQTAMLSLSAEVAIAWFRWVEASEERALLADQIETNQKILQVLEARFSSGQIGSADVLRQRQLIESTREQQYIFDQRAQLLKHLLKTLQGKPPQQDVLYPAPALPALPLLPETGLPSELIQRRPDVRSAFYELSARDAALAAAVADQYPRLNLTASFSTLADSPERLFESWVASVAGQLVAPLLDGGRRRAEVKRREALVREQMADSAQTVLDAFREVEDALLRERQQLKIVDSLTRQLEFNQLAYVQLRSQYLNGALDYLSVLSNLREGQRLQRELLSARLVALEICIALYRALAGGFEFFKESTMMEPDGVPD